MSNTATSDTAYDILSKTVGLPPGTTSAVLSLQIGQPAQVHVTSIASPAEVAAWAKAFKAVGATMTVHVIDPSGKQLPTDEVKPAAPPLPVDASTASPVETADTTTTSDDDVPRGRKGRR